MKECADSLMYIYQYRLHNLLKLVIVKKEKIIYYDSYVYYPDNHNFIFSTHEDAVKFYDLMTYGINNLEHNERLTELQQAIHPSKLEVGWEKQEINISPLVAYFIQAYFIIQSKQAVMQRNADDIESIVATLPHEYSTILKDSVCDVCINNKYSFSMFQKKVIYKLPFDFFNKYDYPCIMDALSEYVTYLSYSKDNEYKDLKDVIHFIKTITINFFILN